MASLSAHFVRSDDHDRLSFHPQCPRCRAERLEGDLTDGPLVPLRVQAALAVGVLACTSLVPSAAFATGVDDEIEGTAAPGQLTPDIEAEGELGETGEVEAEPTEVPGLPTDTLPANETSDELTPEPPSAAPEPEAAGTATEVPGQQEPEVVDTAVPPTNVQPVAEPATDEAPAKHAEKARAKSRARVKREIGHVRRMAKPRVVKQEVRVTPVAAAPAPAVTDAPAPTAATASAPQPRTVAVAASVAQGRAAEPGDESHVVQRGESLWSIAAEVLGDDASPMRIAREVNRLWELNSSRIGTGDRDLLMAGTRLAL